MNKAPLMDTAKINVLPDYPETLKDRKIALFTAQRDSDHEYYSKLIEELNTECEARLKEQSVIHSMQLEQVRKETAEEIITEIENSFQTWRGYKTMEKIRINHDEWQALKSKYGITE